METLDPLPIEGLRVAVQLYGAEPNCALEAYLENRRVEVDTVAPYIYTEAADDSAVRGLIDSLCAGAVDAIAFTSKSQVARLEDVAAADGRGQALNEALSGIVVAAVGPIAAQALEGHGVTVDVMPESDFFMKPLVTRLAERLTARA
jgi:uroporphyrinogen-III synthase